jgi:hypothetical protein
MNHRPSSRATSAALTGLLGLSALAAGCATDGDGRHAVSEAALIDDGATFDVAEAWYSTVGMLQYHAVGTIGGTTRLHHLDVVDYRDGSTPDLAIGVVYLDGPTVDDRGPVDRYVGEDGVLHGDFPTPWIDMLVCDADHIGADVPCRMAERIELWLEDTGTDAVRVHYRASLPGEAPWSASGTFLAVPGTLKG